MKVIEVSQFGEPDVLVLTDRPDLTVGNGQVLVRVEAIGVNPVETYIRAGTYPRLPELPYVPGGNIAGVVQACGTGVTEWQVGDRVYSAATISGGYAECALCDSNMIFRLPDAISFDQGAAVGVPAATAWRALFIRGGGKAGERVLVHGASGSVGLAAIQLARAAGMSVVGTAGSTEGIKLVEEMGANALNHRQADYVQKMVATNAGFDLIIEMLANKNLATDLELLAPGGRVVVVGSRGPIEIDPRATMGKESDIRGLAVFNASPEETKRTHAALAAAMECGTLRPVISAVMPLADVARAHRQVMKDGNCGKIVLHP